MQIWFFPVQEIGKGSYSVCRKCVHKASGEEYAVKVIWKASNEFPGVRSDYRAVQQILKYCFIFCILKVNIVFIAAIFIIM